jgi:hypothetical protein
MSRMCYCFIVVIALSISACMVGMIKPSQEVTIQNTGTDPNIGLQLVQQQDFIFIINSKGHTQNIKGPSYYSAYQYISDVEYTKMMRNAVFESPFALKRKVSSVEEIDPDTTPYLSILENHSWDPCVMYISYNNLEKTEYSSGAVGMGNSHTDYYLKITFTIQLIFYGKYQDQYTVSKEIPYPTSNLSDDFIRLVDLNFRNILDEFYKYRIGY